MGINFHWFCNHLDGFGLFVQEPAPPALIEKKDAVVRVIDQKAENFSKEIVVKGFTKADKKVSVKSETQGKLLIYQLLKVLLLKKAMLSVLYLLPKASKF